MKILHLCKPQQTGLYVTDALSKFVSVKSMQCLNQAQLREVLKTLQAWKPNVLLVHKGGKHLAQAIMRAKKSRILVVCWYYDYVWDHFSKRQAYIRAAKLSQCDLFFATDGGNEKRWKNKLGINKRVLRQGIYDKQHLMIDPGKTPPSRFLNKSTEIIFLGQTYTTYRKRLVELLRKRYGTRFQLLGNTLNNQVRNIELNATLAKIKIVVGESYPSPYYWSNRVYEVTGRGGFLIHTTVKGLEEEFKDGQQIVLYNRGDNTQLFRLIEHYLEDDEARRRIRQSGFKACPTYSQRIQVLLGHIRRMI